MVIGETELPAVESLLDHKTILAMQREVRKVFIEDKLIHYATDLVQATRRPEDYKLELGHYIEFGASPRASIALAQAGRAIAVLEGRDAVVPDDIKAVTHSVLRHRILPTYFATAEKVSTDSMIDEILSSVSVP